MTPIPVLRHLSLTEISLYRRGDANLPDLVQTLAEIGRSAADDDLYGVAWAAWADWCWRASACPLPAKPATAAAYLQDIDCGIDTDVDDLLVLIAAVVDRHLGGGHPDPFAGDTA